MDGLKARLSFDAVAYDYDDEYLTIDTDTHIININNVSRLFGVQYDGNSKLIKFRVRNQLSDIQKMQDSIVYINWIDSKGVKGRSIAIDKTISNDICEFAWKVPFDALKNSGVLHFAVSAFVIKDGSSVIDQRWSTQIASVTTPDGIYIKSYTPGSEEEDRITQIYNKLVKMINEQSGNLQKQVNSLNENLDNYVHKPTLTDNNKFPRAKDGNVEWVEQGLPTDTQTSSAINKWMDAHIEEIATIQNGSITEQKINSSFLPKIKNVYVTPEMFGAKGDGITDDTEAFQKCFDANKKIIIPKGNYLVGQCEVTNECSIEMYDGAHITLKDEYFIHTSEGVITIMGGRFYGATKAQDSRYYAKKVITGKLFDIKITNTRFYQCIALYQTEGNYSGFIHCNNMWVYDSQFIISTKALNFVSCVGCVIQNASNIIEASNYENVSLVNCSIEHVINLFLPTYAGASYNGISITNCYIEYSSLFTMGKCTSIEVRNSWIYTDVTLIALNSGPGYCVISNNSITLLNDTKLINNTNISTLLEFGVGSIKYNNGTIDRNNVNNIYSGTCFVKVLNQETLYMNPTCDTLLFTGKQNTTIKKSISVNGEKDKIYYRPETSGLKASTFIPYILKLGKSDLLSINPPQDCFAIELTTKILYIYDGTNWRKASDGSILE